MKDHFSQSAYVALHDIQLQTALDRGTTRAVNGRIAAMAETTDAQALRRQAAHARERALNKLPELLEKLEANVIKNGGQVLWAQDGAEANQLILALCQEHGVRAVTKAKSMVAEEIDLAHALHQHGIECTESDLGEYIIQLADEKPSHIVFPVLHKTKEQVGEVLHEKIAMPPTDDAEKMTRFVRHIMRRKYIEADLGISGVNFAIAETGTIVTVENEGNNRLSAGTPRIHVAIMGLEKVIENAEDFTTLVQLLSRSATGQRLTVYVSLMTGPQKSFESDGPEKFYLLILDNGRSRILGTEYAEALKCIRCGACLNICPVYQNIGGHAYGSVYPGPIGAVFSPLLHGVSTMPSLPHASSLCGACQSACPVDIAIPDMLLKLRRDLVQQGGQSWGWRLGMRLWRMGMRSPLLYKLGGWFVALATHAIKNQAGLVAKVPPPFNGWTNSRDFRPFATKSFRQRYRQRRAKARAHPNWCAGVGLL